MDELGGKSQSTFAIKLVIPDDLKFSDLRLTRDAAGGVRVDWVVIARICEASGLPLEWIAETSENLGALIFLWYRQHRKGGGAPNPAAEASIAAALAATGVELTDDRDIADLSLGNDGDES
ncbi:MAG: hypothetical protein CVV05_00030 [Gammaproteobacteria bacterium HGW-Gammaproteobacteria-1]|jgi:hypothetical protein|nr:MAG: hypothetical protein CVV05_00030 [Gammaproteobacteria bacterium HGW-Gammaproteobacteria-1]